MIPLDISEEIALGLCLGLPQDSVRCRVDLQELSEPGILICPGLKDIQMAQITRLGHKDSIPRPWDWENLLSSLRDGEELLWIASKEHSQFSLTIALKQNKFVVEDVNTVRDRSKRFSALAGGFYRRAFPESKLERLEQKQIDSVLSSISDLSEEECILVTGVPSPKHLEAKTVVQTRKDAGKAYSSLNDVLEALMEEEKFNLVFSLTKASAADVLEEINKLNKVRSELSPHLKWQETSGTSSQTGSQRSQSTSETSGKTLQESSSIGRSIWKALFGAKKDSKGLRKVAPSYSTTGTFSETKTTSESISESRSISSSFSDSGLVMIDNHLELLVEHLRQCQGTGGYYGAVAVHAPDPYSRRRIANCLVGVLSGSQTQLRPFQQLECTGPDACFDIKCNLPPCNVVDGVALMNVHHASALFLLPESELPGLQLKRSIFYGRASEREPSDENVSSYVSLGTAAFGDPTLIGEEGVTTGRTRRQISIPSRHLLSHMLITGATGSGKTIRAIKTLNRLPEEYFTIHVLETAKKVYRSQLRRGKTLPTIFNLGGFDGKPLRINPFYFDNRTSLKRHISVLCDALSDLLPVEALIGPKLREAVLNCYNSSGWNIETGRYEGSEGAAIFPDMIDFNREIARICSRLSYSSELNENYRGALSGRARVFIDDLYQDVFSYDGNAPFEDLFGEDCIIELADLPPSEINMPGFIVSLYLERLRAWRSAKLDPGAPPYSLVVIEEAHNILHKRHEQEKNQYQTGGGKHLVEQVNRLLQEGRELGIGVMVVDQSPRSLADSVMVNTNTKLVHRLLDGDEAGTIGKSIGLKPDEWQDIHFLEDGECIVSLKHGGRPHKMAPFDEFELPERFTSSAEERRPPEYAAGERLLVGISMRSSLYAIRLASEELLRFCNGDLALADYMIGKHLAWNHLLDKDTDLTRSRNSEELTVRLCGIHRYGLNPRLEFSRLLVCAIMDQRYGEIGLARRVFGQGWVNTAASSFLQCARELCSQMGNYESVLESLQSVVPACLQVDLEQSGITSRGLDQLRLFAACPENLNLAGMVISQSLCESLLGHTEFVKDAAPRVLAGRWNDVHDLLKEHGHLTGLEPLEECIVAYFLKAFLSIMADLEEAYRYCGIQQSLDNHLESLLEARR